ncbi:tyrosinase family protein [Microbacterium sp. 4R-513]|uniref:tyrosinase family protein n=1 Tax=Microbacterium sp. 4R-513 TaxID=2567934 RepID=UPI0013E1FF68|nr:tyrosinase family protein [Microbacterium sp. 4R-513]QIG38706.1 tyrosinase family protein [Microbacterium sp. 4R-513]
MSVTVTFPRYDDRGRAFVTWRPVEVKIAVKPPQAGAALNVRVSARSAAGGGRLAFATSLTHAGAASVDLSLPASGSAVSVWVGGAFPAASAAFGDVTVEVRDRTSNALLASHPTMVRVRKNADRLTTAERDRFLRAMAVLNGAGNGRFRDFRDMHVSGPPDREAHGGTGFLPWHRIYLLDLERELQAIDGEVSLPYWRFDQAAPNVFTRQFMGVSGPQDRVQFTPTNPLRGWVAGALPGVERGPGVGPQTVPLVRTEQQTLALGGSPVADFTPFASMQGNPHGRAHMAHLSGVITDPGTAPQDPLFFLLHCNVDRLWAKWQWAFRRHDPGAARAYAMSATLPGHRIGDRLWPWGGPLQAPRPTTAPGGQLNTSPMTDAPGLSPRIRDTIDYLGTVAPAHLGFAYDDVPFQLVGANP